MKKKGRGDRNLPRGFGNHLPSAIHQESERVWHDETWAKPDADFLHGLLGTRLWQLDLPLHRV